MKLEIGNLERVLELKQRGYSMLLAVWSFKNAAVVSLRDIALFTSGYKS